MLREDWLLSLLIKKVKCQPQVIWIVKAHKAMIQHYSCHTHIRGQIWDAPEPELIFLSYSYSCSCHTHILVILMPYLAGTSAKTCHCSIATPPTPPTPPTNARRLHLAKTRHQSGIFLLKLFRPCANCKSFSTLGVTPWLSWLYWRQLSGRPFYTAM